MNNTNTTFMYPKYPMQKVLIGIAVLLLLTSGGVIGFFLRQEKPTSQVLGESITKPFWQNNVLLINNNNKLFSWDKEHNPQPIDVLAGKRVATAAVTHDQQLAVVVIMENGTSTFWLHSAERQARPFASVQGDVSQLSFSASGKLLLFVQQRQSVTVPELDLLSLSDGTIRRVADNAISGSWLADPVAVLSQSSDGQMRYHQFMTDGSLDSISIPVVTASNPATTSQSDHIVFVKKADEGMSLIRFTLSTQEQQLIVPLPGIQADARNIHLQISDSDKEAIIIWTEQNGTQQTVFIHIDSGIVATLTTIAQKLDFLGDQSAVIERASSDGGGIAVLRLDDAQFHNIPETETLHLLP